MEIGAIDEADAFGLLMQYPVTATSFHLIGNETERGWEQNDDISTLTPSLVRYGSDTGVADEQLRQRLLEIPLAFLEFETGLSRHTNRANKKRSTSTHTVIAASQGCCSPGAGSKVISFQFAVPNCRRVAPSMTTDVPSSGRLLVLLSSTDAHPFDHSHPGRLSFCVLLSSVQHYSTFRRSTIGLRLHIAIHVLDPRKISESERTSITGNG